MTGLILLSLMPLLSVATIVDVMRTRPEAIRVLHRGAWALIVCLPLFGPLLWFTLARPYGSARPSSASSATPGALPPAARGVRAPDDDAEFLRVIQARVEREKRRSDGGEPAAS